MITFVSAKDLCMRSCAQIKLFRDFPDRKPKPSEDATAGEKYQHAVARYVPGLIGEEMGAWAMVGENLAVAFSNDIVCNDKIIEVKTVRTDKPVESWFLNGSLLQCAVYRTLVRMVGGSMKTAKFYANLGYPVVETTVGPDIPYYLMFGRDYYRVTVKDYQAISDFIVGKANATMSWDSARSFDAEWKHREFEKLNGCFEYEKINFIPNLKKKKEVNEQNGNKSTKS